VTLPCKINLAKFWARATRDPRVERAIILQFLRDDHEHRWSRAELEVEISNIEPLDINDALARLDQNGIVQISGESVWASRAVRRLDELRLIAI
jgi:hypothetical protein